MNKVILDRPTPGSKGSPDPLLIYEISRPYQLENGQWTTEILEWGQATEAQLKEIRKEKLEGFPDRRIIVNHPYKGPEWISTGTLEAWIGRMRG